MGKKDKALRAKYGKAKGKHKPGPAELANDPSLRWCPYRSFELVWSDAHATEMRFNGYNDDGTVSLANMAMSPVPGSYDPLSIRRPTARAVEDKVWAGKYGGGARPRGSK